MKNRIACIDTLRGIAIILMIIFHFCFDLEYFKIYNFHITTNPFFTNFRIVIVTLFLFIVGVSLTLTHKDSINWLKVKKRAFILAIVSLSISLVTYYIFPHSWIYFGIIHFILIASIVALIFLNHKVLAFIIGVLIILFYNLNYLNMHYIFKSIAPYLHLPLYHTQDLVPFIPWFGVVLIGISFSNILMKICKKDIIANISQKLKIVNFMGKYSLFIYLIHQIILFSIFFIVLSIIS